jgi:hypothetical protein
VKDGAVVCRWHGGRAPQTAAAAERRGALAKVAGEMARLGVGIEVDPAEALLAMVYEAAGNVAFLRQQVAQLPVHPVMRHVELVDEDGEVVGHQAEVVEAGLYGPDHLGDARRHVLVRLYEEERTRLANFSRMALAAGVEERRVSLAERQGAQIAEVIVEVLDAMDLTAEQREVGRRVAAERLRSLAA